MPTSTVEATIARRAEQIAAAAGVSLAKLRSPARPDHLAVRRFIAYALLREDGWGVNEVARDLNRTHGAVSLGVQRWKARCETDPKARELMDLMRGKIKQARPNS